MAAEMLFVRIERGQVLAFRHCQQLRQDRGAVRVQLGTDCVPVTLLDPPICRLHVDAPEPAIMRTFSILMPIRLG